MSISIFELFSIGIGPSSSHTMGPMRAANRFLSEISPELFEQIEQVTCTLYGSLAFTCRGHGTDKAIINGLAGFHPESVDPDQMMPFLEQVSETQKLSLLGKHEITFDIKKDLKLKLGEFLPKHSNALQFRAFDKDQQCIGEETFYSIGGGFIVRDAEFDIEKKNHNTIDMPYPFKSAKELLQHCKKHEMTIANVMLENEKTLRREQEIYNKIDRIAAIMKACIEKGCHTKGILPGGLNVRRRAADLYQKLEQRKTACSSVEKDDIMNRLNVFAMAVNEENAAGGRVVTAPTNGAAGIIPAVMAYYENFHRTKNPNALYDYFLTAGAIAILYKKGASISGAEVGCQGEVGVASSMAAAGLAAALGGSVLQIENAAEIAMEHHLGMTCDPMNGLVQIPCIERNAMGALKAVNAARLALMEDGEHNVSLDKVIATMMQTGKDMLGIYKETSEGGLAVNHPEC